MAPFLASFRFDMPRYFLLGRTRPDAIRPITIFRAPATSVRIVISAVAMLLASQSCSSTSSDRGRVIADGARVDLTGAGATFPYPLYSRWFNDYAQRTNVRINYQSIGSGGGIRQMLEGTVDFGATDVPMSDTERSKQREPIIHIPTVVGAVAVTYNLPQLEQPLNLSGDLLADIFLGRITKWNDARVAALNAGISMPSSDILVVHRADGSGTSYIFSDYLTAVSAAWSNGPGRGKDVRWPVGIGGKGNDGVAGQVKQIVGSLGFLEVVYAHQNHLPVARIQNRAGSFVLPTPVGVAAAASDTGYGAFRDSTFRVSLVDASGDGAYPICSFTWMLIAPQRIGSAKTLQLVTFLRWALTDGGDMASALGYVALPRATAAKVLERLNVIAPLTTARP